MSKYNAIEVEATIFGITTDGQVECSIRTNCRNDFGDKVVVDGTGPTPSQAMDAAVLNALREFCGVRLHWQTTS